MKKEKLLDVSYVLLWLLLIKNQELFTGSWLIALTGLIISGIIFLCFNKGEKK